MNGKPESFVSLLLQPDDLLGLEPEDLAPLLLEYLSRASGQEMNRYNFTLQSGPLSSCPPQRYKQVARAVTEAWMVLEREGLLAPQPGTSGEWMYITRRGESLLKRGADFRAYFRGNLLPTQFLDSALALKVRPLFLRGDYDTAIFAAFKEVEVQVREGAGLPQELLGTDLMRKALDADQGPLRDATLPTAERQAAAHFFAGAIGLFKNPSSHRHVSYTPEEAADLIRLANYLIRWAKSLSEWAKMNF